MDKYNKLIELSSETDRASFCLRFKKKDKKHSIRIGSKLFESTDINKAINQAIDYIQNNRTNVGTRGYRLD